MIHFGPDGSHLTGAMTQTWKRTRASGAGGGSDLEVAELSNSEGVQPSSEVALDTGEAGPCSQTPTGMGTFLKHKKKSQMIIT